MCVFFLLAVNTDAIAKVAQNMPSHMLHSLSQVANQTPHYPHTPGAYAQSSYVNTVSVRHFAKKSFLKDYIKSFPIETNMDKKKWFYSHTPQVAKRHLWLPTTRPIHPRHHAMGKQRPLSTMDHLPIPVRRWVLLSTIAAEVWVVALGATTRPGAHHSNSPCQQRIRRHISSATAIHRMCLVHIHAMARRVKISSGSELMMHGDGTRGLQVGRRPRIVVQEEGEFTFFF